MAEKQNDSDSDEYEVMVAPTQSSPTAAELTVIEATTASEILQISKSLTPQGEKDKKAKVAIMNDKLCTDACHWSYYN